MSTGQPTTFKFHKYEHLIGASECVSCWDFEAPLCSQPRCEGRLHNEIERYYVNEMGDFVSVVATCCDDCGGKDRYEWVELDDDEEDEELEEVD